MILNESDSNIYTIKIIYIIEYFYFIYSIFISITITILLLILKNYILLQ